MTCLISNSHIFFRKKKKHCTWPSSCVFAAHRGTIFEKVAPQKRCKGPECPFRVHGLARIVSRGPPVSHINHPVSMYENEIQKNERIITSKKGNQFQSSERLVFELRTNPCFPEDNLLPFRGWIFHCHFFLMNPRCWSDIILGIGRNKKKHPKGQKLPNIQCKKCQKTKEFSSKIHIHPKMSNLF